MLIDAHQHIWRVAAPWHQWPQADLGAIHRDYDVEDLRQIRDSAGVSASVLVQSQPADEDTDWLLERAAQDPSILGVVGWADLKAEDAVARVTDLSRRPKLVGLRPMLQSLPSGWILDAALDPVIGVLLTTGLRFDALVTPRQLPDLVAFVRRWPELAVVLDHSGKPALSGESFEAWRAAMAILADNPAVFCKLSGLLTEGNPDQALEVDRIAETVFALFGSDRILWGSDWPVVTLRTGYANWLKHSRRLCAMYAPGAEAEVFGRNANRFYGLNAKL
ncbi:amidohydrolase family protein [Brevundimonas intermedia]|uniref:amidohydrolase family protein n=1 Tax=Brevundimonas intermedia TaxID=74315 RepID=UPI0032094E2B